jgi:hypothetical protein
VRKEKPRPNPLPLFALIACCATLASAQVTESRTLTPIELEAQDRLGCAVDVSGGVVAVGARLDDDDGLNAGAVYLFDPTDGARLGKLLPSDSIAGGGFGTSVAIDLEHTTPYLVVGKPSDRELGIDGGAAYVFNAGTGLAIAKYLAPSGNAGNKFGTSVAIDGGIAVIGAPENSTNGPRSGRAYVYNLDTGTLLHTLQPKTPQNESLFGWSIAISDGMVVVGARREQGAGSNSGVAYVFSAATGQQLARFTPADNAANDQFGYAVALSGDTAAIGAVGDGDNGAASGSVYIYDISLPAAPVMLHKLLASDGFAGDELGRAVDIAPIAGGHRVAAGAWRTGNDVGAAYVFDLDAAGATVSQTRLGASNAIDNAVFGVAVTIGNDGRVIVGAEEDDALFNNAGGVYVFDDPDAPPCPADLTEDGQLNFFDVAAFIAAYNAQSPDADLAAPFGVLNFFDVAAYIALYNAGCP